MHFRGKKAALWLFAVVGLLILAAVLVPCMIRGPQPAAGANRETELR